MLHERCSGKSMARKGPALYSRRSFSVRQRFDDEVEQRPHARQPSQVAMIPDKGAWSCGHWRAGHLHS